MRIECLLSLPSDIGRRLAARSGPAPCAGTGPTRGSLIGRLPIPLEARRRAVASAAGIAAEISMRRCAVARSRRGRRVLAALRRRWRRRRRHGEDRDRARTARSTSTRTTRTASTSRRSTRRPARWTSPCVEKGASTHTFTIQDPTRFELEVTAEQDRGVRNGDLEAGTYKFKCSVRRPRRARAWSADRRRVTVAGR